MIERVGGEVDLGDPSVFEDSDLDMGNADGGLGA